ncbi:MAG: K+/H+ antiporter subunit F [Gemmobacter sp.]|uniref:K+/H+ antiporter subunit F n=1 Tax=Gemmobacter sp. TaxID=1898957 RepID=UPI00391A0812
MIEMALIFAFACFGLGLLMNLYRVAVAPGVPDRVLALDTMVINVIALMILYGMWQGTGIYFEAALLFAMTGFISTVAYARYMLRGDIIE